MKKMKKNDGLFHYILSLLKQKPYARRFVIAAISFGLLYTFLYGIWKVPGIDFGIERMTELGIADYAYLAIISVLTGVLFALMKFERAEKSAKLTGAGGFLTSLFAGVCPACQGVNILAVGSTIFSIPLVFLVPYIGLLQILTVLILGFAVLLKANSIYTKVCITCV